MRHIPVMASTGWILLAKMAGFASLPLRLLAVMLTATGLYSIRRLAAVNEASPIHKGMVGFTAAATLCVWAGPPFAWPARFPVAALYAVLFLVAVLPPLLGREPFTSFFARKTTPPAAWTTDVFRTINRHLTALWATLFAAGFGSALVAGLFANRGFLWEALFEVIVLAVLMLGIGVPANRRYPIYYQRRIGLVPAADAGTASGATPTEPPTALTSATAFKKEKTTMESRFTVIAVNGSPHTGIGNTALLLEMLRQPLADNGCTLDVVALCDHEIDYCTGCAHCLEKGQCWIPDGHRAIAERLLAADGIILASPVYFFHVTAQMKAFLDRSLAWGHKPRPSWKPGLAVSVSAGQGETETADYLAKLLRVYGAFPVGRLTAMATSPGEFLGREAVEARARDLARDLALAIREKRRYPVTDVDLRFYLFMENLVLRHKDTIMSSDYAHWEKHGLFRDFESYVQQRREKTSYDPEIRKAWIQELIARNKAKRERQEMRGAKGSTAAAPLQITTCRELLEMMPLAFDPAAAQGLETVYQFDVSGKETLQAHLKISGEKCTYHEGPAAAPGVVIRTPGEVWLAIAAGELDGQQAFMSGKYSVEGDLALLLKLKSLFPAPQRQK
jgi:multimeric flavodoxin WrbA/putative sterol carrier protein